MNQKFSVGAFVLATLIGTGARGDTLADVTTGEPSPRVVATAEDELSRLVHAARTADGLRRTFAELGDPFVGVTPERFVALAMSGRFTIDGEDLRAGDAFRLVIGRDRLLAGEVSQHQMQIFAGLAPYVHDFADFLTLARAPGPEPFVRNLVSSALVVGQAHRFREWALSPLDWATILSFWSPESITPRECARLIDAFRSERELRVALTGVARPEWRHALERAAVQRRVRRGRCHTLLSTPGRTARYP